MTAQTEPTITMTDDLALPGRVALTMMGVSIERRRRILELRAQRDRIRDELARTDEALTVEEADLAQEHTTVSELFDQWQKILDAKFAEARALAEPPGRTKHAAAVQPPEEQRQS